MIALSEVRSVGFTGTQKGMTADQLRSVLSLLQQLPNLLAVRHGDCIGADDNFDLLVRTHFPNVTIYVYPPRNPSKRAWTHKRGATTVYPVAEYLNRNKAIVRDSDMLIGAPSSIVEQLRSGTWSTIRYATKLGKAQAIVYP